MASSSNSQNDDGKFIAASQRPDGTWRKARRVKDGYVPQEEVPLYESKGKQFTTRKSDLPVGMYLSPTEIDKKVRLKKEKAQQQQQIPGLIKIKTNPTNVANINGAVKKQKPTATKNKSNSNGCDNIEIPNIIGLSIDNNDDGVGDVESMNQESVEKSLKKLRKKINEIDIIENKLKSGELKNPEQDQLDKVGRKTQIENKMKILTQRLEQLLIN